MSGALWAKDLPWTRLKQLAEANAVALLPVGSTEAHGPHLPLSVDVLIAEEVCRRVARELKSAVIFPALTYGLTDFAAPFAGTISVGGEVLEKFLADVLTGITGHGFKTVGVINHHLEPAHFSVVHKAVKAATERSSGARIAATDHRRKPTGPLLGDEFMHGGSHAGNYETSLMLAIAPQLVDESARKKLPELAVDLPAKIKAGAKSFLECGGPDAYLGDPAGASAAEGERLLKILVSDAVAALSTVA
ncbi:MAG: creatininase family protein [Myxococcaceae bacterium]